MKFLIFINLILLTTYCWGQPNINQAFSPAGKLSQSQFDTITNSVFKPGPDTSAYKNLCHKYFVQDGDFTKISFNGVGTLYCSIFDKDAIFYGTSFNGVSDFSGTTFRRDANFTSCTFHGFLFMSGVGTDSVTVFNFYNAKLPLLIDFSHNQQMHGTVDFTNANFDSLYAHSGLYKDKHHYINIYNSDIPKLKLDYIHFRLCFYDPRKWDNTIDSLVGTLKKHYPQQPGNYSPQIRDALMNASKYRDYIAEVLPKSKLSDTLVNRFTTFYLIFGHFPSRLYADQIDALYSRLQKNFETRGQEDSYNALNTDYQDYRWSRIRYFSILHIFPKYWNSYSRSDYLILLWAPAIFLILTLITFVCYGRIFKKGNENKVVYHLEHMAGTKPPEEKNWGQKFHHAFIFTAVIFFSFSLKTEKIDFRHPSFLYIVLINCLGLLCLAYLANYILQK
jgi:hypothetical protein